MDNNELKFCCNCKYHTSKAYPGEIMHKCNAPDNLRVAYDFYSRTTGRIKTNQELNYHNKCAFYVEKEIKKPGLFAVLFGGLGCCPYE